VIPRFALARPTSLAQAFAAFAAADGDAAWYAGGTELLQVMKMGLARPATLIDLKGLRELRGISVADDGTVVIGALTTHRELERSPFVAREVPALARLETSVANIRVRNQGTLGGNLCFAEPHSDPATFLLACDARVTLRGPAGERALPLAAFLVESFVTAREPDEILIDVRVPAAATGEGRAYEKAKFRERPAVSVAVRVRVAGGAIAEATVAIGSMIDAPVVVPDAGRAIVGVAAGSEAEAGSGSGALADPLALARHALDGLDAVDDLDGSAEYKRHLAGVLLGRALRAALDEATGRSSGRG
jgi:carbon-monoxide dehydrogenase medium subunit